MREPDITVVESTAVSLVRSGMGGQVLGVECKTRGEKDYVRRHHSTTLVVTADTHTVLRRSDNNIRRPRFHLPQCSLLEYH